MKRLILMRHAKSDWSAAGDDHSRPLNARGKTNAAVMGTWLRGQGWLPDEVLCSTATRTRQTLDLLDLPKTPTRFERGLYLAEGDEIMDVLREARGDCVLLLGHNYGIADCAQSLVEVPPEHARFEDYPTCATSLIRFDITDWGYLLAGTGVCEAFAIPREVIAAQESNPTN